MRRSARSLCLRLVVLCASTALLGAPALGVSISIEYGDSETEGFFAPDSGAARRAALEYAVARWQTALGGTTPITLHVAFDPLGGDGASALLASTAPVTVHRNFPHAPLADTLYSAALANQLAEDDLNGPDLAEIDIIFNADVDGLVTLGSVGWYYGTDGEPGSDIDFVTIAMHEIGHGLGFSNQIAAALGRFAFNVPGIFDIHTARPRVGRLAELLPAERRVAWLSNQLIWDGPYVFAANNGAAELYAPDPFINGSSVSHWDASLHELMAPFYLGPNHAPGLLLPALIDMGWQLPQGTAAPPSAPPTATPTPKPTATPSGIVERPRQIVFVSNFDDDTVSVLDHLAAERIGLIAVGDGPIGIAADTSAGRILVANFRDGSLSVIDAESRAVTHVIETGGSPNAIALVPAKAYVSDTAGNRVLVIDSDKAELISSITVGRQPAGVTASVDGSRVFVAHFGEPNVDVIDTETDLVRAQIAFEASSARGLQSIAFAPDGQEGYITAFHSRIVLFLNPLTLIGGGNLGVTLDSFDFPEAILVGPGSRFVYTAVHVPETGAGKIRIIDLDDQNATPATIPVGFTPEAMALTPDGSIIYVANTGSNSVTQIGTATNRRGASFSVGSTPMGVAAIALPPACAGDCDGSRLTTIDEILTGIGIALGDRPLAVCRAFDRDGNGHVAINDIVAAIRAALDGCARVK